MKMETIDTPALILDVDRLNQNAARMREHCKNAGVTLRPHLKTPKCVEVALAATDGRMSTVTVSTLAEAEHFARAGFDDLLYAVGVTPRKFDRLESIQRETGKTITLILDSLPMAQALAASPLQNPALIEIDCGEHRGGLGPSHDELINIARALGAQFGGLMSHAGHSYSTNDLQVVEQTAQAEVDAANLAARRLRDAGLTVATISIGSTPTVLHARDFTGITEVRAGIYLFYDLCQYGRNICSLDDLALTVLTSVIGHNREAGLLTLDAGALALSKDVGANTFLPDAGYGWVCDAESLEPLGLSVSGVHQEHGTVKVDESSVFERLPIGSVVRVMPGHACLTAAGGYGRYHLTDGRIWNRVDGW